MKLDPNFQQLCPQLWQAIFGRRYVLPNYRQADYESQEKLNSSFLAELATSVFGPFNDKDETRVLQLINFYESLYYDRPLCTPEASAVLNGARAQGSTRRKTKKPFNS